MKHVRGAALLLEVTISEEKINFFNLQLPRTVSAGYACIKDIPSHFPSANLNRNH